MVSCLGSLVQSCCGEGGTLQTNITGVHEEYSQCVGHTGFGHTGFAPLSRHVCFSRLHCSDFRLLCRKWALGCMHFLGLSCSGPGSWVFHRSTDLVRLPFCAIPWSEQLRRPGAWQAHSQVWCVLSPPRSQPLGFLDVPSSGVPCISSGELNSGCDPPGRYQLS